MGRRRKARQKCNRCVPGNSTRIYVGAGTYVVTQCAICKNQMTQLELMRPRLAIVQSREE